ncbi:MAG: hypothetical protein ACETWE_02605 [Candidatus Bathyarchaeia archaeon]
MSPRTKNVLMADVAEVDDNELKLKVIGGKGHTRNVKTVITSDGQKVDVDGIEYDGESEFLVVPKENSGFDRLRSLWGKVKTNLEGEIDFSPAESDDDY